MADDETDEMLAQLMGDQARVVVGELLTAHITGLGNVLERWGQRLSKADAAAVLDHIKAAQRLSITLNAGMGS